MWTLNMDSRTLWALNMDSRTLWTLMSLLLSVLCREVTVKHSDLKLCDEHKQACVTDLDDCSPRPATATLKTLNMSCIFDYLEDYKAVTCAWSEDDDPSESEVSLIFSRNQRIYSCTGMLNPVAILDVTARIKDVVTGGEAWSRPHTLNLSKAARPPPPGLTLLSSSEDSVLVSWRCTDSCICRFQFRENRTQTWTQAPDLVSVNKSQTLTYTVKNLLPYTVYRAVVSCREDTDIWSRWSNEVTAQTLDRAPSSAPEVYYRMEKTDSADFFRLHLMWKDLDSLKARILGYQVVYEPERQQNLQDRFIETVTEGTALLVVKVGNCSITVRAFNTAGYGPAARLSIDTQRRETLPAVRHLWASSSTKALLVQWETSSDAPPSLPPVNHFAVLWRSETRMSSTRWTKVDNISSSAVIRDLDPEDSYLIRVFPVQDQQCGPPRSLPVSLQRGALMEAGRLKVDDVTKTTVTVSWVWRRRSLDGPDRVEGYSVMLKGGSEGLTHPLWPDQSQHTFHNLKPSSEYSLLLLADNSSRSILTVTTNFDEVPVVATVVPLLLLAALLFVAFVLSRTVYKSYFFPLISSPRGSTTGQWLMDPNHLKPAEGNILDIEDFHVTDVLRHMIVVTPSSEKEPREDASLLSLRNLVLTLDPDYMSDAHPVFPDPVLVSPMSPYHPVYSVNCPPADQGHVTQDAGSGSLLFLQKEEVKRPVCEVPRQRETDFRSLLQELMSNTAGGCVPQASSEARRVVNASCSQGRSDVETNCSLICDGDYIANGGFRPGTG